MEIPRFTDLHDYLAELESAARAATEGEWVAHSNREKSWVESGDGVIQIAETGYLPNARYITLASPELILNLIHHYRISEGRNDAFIDHFIERVTERTGGMR